MRVSFSLLFLIGVALLLTANASAVEPFGARHPALSPDASQLAFDWQGDIWVVSAGGGPATRLTDHVAHDAYPCWSPDGREIAFSSTRNGNADVYVVSVDGGTPERITTHSDDDWICDWSPTGDRIYFQSWRESRMPLLYSVPRSGGRAVRVTHDLSFEGRVSPDGRRLAYVRGYDEWWRKHYRGPASFEIWVRPLAGGESNLVVTWDGDDDRPFWSPDGRALYFQSEREDGVRNLYRQDLNFGPDSELPGPATAAGAAVEITHLTGDGIQFLQVSRDGRFATYESMGQLYIVPTSGGEPRRVVIDCPGDLKLNALERRMVNRGVTEFAFAPGDSQVAFVVEGEIYAGVVKDGEMREPVRITETDARESDLAWLDGETLLFVSDRFGNDDIFSVRSTDKEEPRLGKSRYREVARLTDSPDTEQHPQVSPDRQTILYLRGERFMWTMAPDGSQQKLLLDEPAVLHCSWSPDSRYVAYSVTTLGYAEDIFIFNVKDGGPPVNVSNHPNDDFHPLWSDDGKRLSWASRTDDGFYNIKYLWLTRAEADKSDAERKREEEAEEDSHKDHRGNGEGEAKDKKHKEEPPEVRIDWKDIPERIRTVATVRGYYWDYDASPDGKHYALRTNVIEGMDLWTVDWDGNHLRRMTTGGADPGHLRWSEDNERVRYISDGQFREIKNEEDAKPSTFSFNVELTVDNYARREQMFNEAWRLLNDGFYDEHFHGCDWQAMRAKYEPIALAMVMHEDFNDVLRMMIGELNASHLGVSGPWEGGGDATGLLGFTPDDAWQGPGVRVAEVLPEGPLDREGRRVEAGEIILAIDGHEIARGEDYYPLLNHKAGKEVDLRVASSGEGKGARTVTIEPANDLWRLTYKHWTDENRSHVDSLSAGRLGYVHMSAMGDRDWDRFIEDVFSRAHGKEGLILDVRNNNGGTIHDRVLDFLSRRPYLASRMRGERDTTYDALWRWDGPVVVITNERSYSDGESFPAGFKQLRLGRIVGMPTFGAVIGTDDVHLIDGTGFRVPGTGWYRMDGTSLENNPVQPDVVVREVPEENLRGRDAQLEAAVGECLGMIKK